MGWALSLIGGGVDVGVGRGVGLLGIDVIYLQTADLMIRVVKTEGDGGPMLETFLHNKYSRTESLEPDFNKREGTVKFNLIEED